MKQFFALIGDKLRTIGRHIMSIDYRLRTSKAASVLMAAILLGTTFGFARMFASPTENMILFMSFAFPGILPGGILGTLWMKREWALVRLACGGIGPFFLLTAMAAATSGSDMAIYMNVGASVLGILIFVVKIPARRGNAGTGHGDGWQKRRVARIKAFRLPWTHVFPSRQLDRRLAFAACLPIWATSACGGKEAGVETGSGWFLFSLAIGCLLMVVLTRLIRPRRR